MLSSNTSAVSGDANYIEDVFSTYLFTGTGSATAINNGIDLSTKGGLVWIKDRNSGAMGHALFDTARGGAYKLQSQSTGAQSSYNNIVFGTTGFTNDTQSDNNNSGTLYTSWTFRKQPKFFDVVTYTGNGSTQNIAHNLGSAPGCIIVKCTSNAGQDWFVYHRTQGNGYGLLNTTDSWGTYTGYWNNTAPTSTQFSVGTSNGVNGNGYTYVAYIFAHNAGGFGLTGTDNVISCGSYTTDAGGEGPVVNLGWEPQFIIQKDINYSSGSGGDWDIIDNMRGFPSTSSMSSKFLEANTSAAEQSSGYIGLTSTGFRSGGTASHTYIYIAIRRGPMKVPTDGTKVYNTVTANAASTPTTITFNTTLNGADWGWSTNLNNANRAYGGTTVFDRLRGSYYLFTNNTDAEANSAGQGFSGQTSYIRSFGSGDVAGHFFKRAPSFFDEVCYPGTGSAMTISHNLGTAPQLIILKERNASGGWIVYSSPTGFSVGGNLAGTGAFSGGLAYVSATSSTTFTTITNATTWVSYLFATCAGVSKVGSYTGTGTTQQVDCGFAAGARFVLIKRTDSTGDWYVWDTARGIVSGNDPYLLLNSTAAEVTITDYIDTYSAGFELSTTAAATVNVIGGSYIFLAIA